ncbi:cytochrome-c peroxidase [Desulfurispirillum indicum]|uniref:cytochrome-c peroxidase n=1 Tax=Desulfurispirillum indicum TaxID=936456 RepID=UPI001CFBACC8|nr:cytochrome c peroxidase [Desulfurispirillum indicum]UCZ57212.1 cytochrome-c peroxidase [Desulfurispirillum indicum]
MKEKKSKGIIFGTLAIVGTSLIIAACSGSSQQALDPKEVFSNLGPMPVPADNPMTPEKIELGKMLYFDTRLSGDNTLSCASCHEPEKGWSDGRRTFLGFQGHQGHRNSPTIINSGYHSLQFLDGRMKTLEDQALGPIQDPGEMNLSLDELVQKLNAVPAYVQKFEEIFGPDSINPTNIGKAIATFERTIVIDNTPFDQYLKGNSNAMSKDAQEGMKLFAGKASCISCHNGPSLSDNNFHNVGVLNDNPGRAGFTGNPEDDGKYKTTHLRGIGHTAPFMHNGSLRTLSDVVEFKNRGGDGHPNTSPLVRPLNLSDKEKAQLVAFLEALTGELPLVAKPQLP